jgi:hypothetical protein
MTEVGLSARLLRAEQRIRSAKRIVIMLASGILALSVWQAWTFYRFVHRQTLTLNNKTPHAGARNSCRLFEAYYSYRNATMGSTHMARRAGM